MDKDELEMAFRKGGHVREGLPREVTVCRHSKDVERGGGGMQGEEAGPCPVWETLKTQGGTVAA